MRTCSRHNSCRAFTIIELLVVVAIIIVLLSIIIVAVNAAIKTSQSANTQALMSSINKGLVQFRNDIGYLPPVLDEERGYVPPPNPNDSLGEYLDDMQEYYSFTTLPEYLIGYGDATEDGYGRDNWKIAEDQGIEPYETDGPLGIRHPGTDGYWSQALQPGGKAGTYEDRTIFLADRAAAQFLQGRNHGPYIELRDDRLLAVILGITADGTLRLAFPGDANYDDTAPRVIVDYWGQPIRFYRKPYMIGMPHQEFRQGLVSRLPTLSDVYALRPYRPGEAIDVLDAPDASGIDTTTTHSLQSASFALLSAGPDQRIDQNYRVDPEEYNRDNTVEVGQ